eukprot:7329210-Prymnesium_polylepis.1
MDRPLFQLLLFRQWAGNLRARLANALVIGTNEYTCRVMRNESIPCFVDKLAPQLTGKQNFFGSQVLLKWWYAKALLSLRFHIVFSDPDIAWVRDPFGTWDESYDLQGLSDIRSVNLTVQKHHEITCIRVRSPPTRRAGALGSLDVREGARARRRHSALDPHATRQRRLSQRASGRVALPRGVRRIL